MKVVNKQAVAAHDERVASIVEQHRALLDALDEAKPQPLTLQQHPEGEAPKVLVAKGAEVVVMGGDYFHESEESAFAVAAADVGEGGAWEIVEE